MCRKIPLGILQKGTYHRGAPSPRNIYGCVCKLGYENGDALKKVWKRGVWKRVWKRGMKTGMKTDSLDVAFENPPQRRLILVHRLPISTTKNSMNFSFDDVQSTNSWRNVFSIKSINSLMNSTAFNKNRWLLTKTIYSFILLGIRLFSINIDDFCK